MLLIYKKIFYGSESRMPLS